MRIAFKLLIVCLSFSLNSCKWFESKEAITDRIIKQDMQTIDWNQIDRYPLFDNCDESASLVSQQSCFALEIQAKFSSMIDSIKRDYAKELIELESIILQITNEGSFRLIEVRYKETNKTKLDSIIKSGLEALKPINPAIKRGVPVSVYYKMPFKVAVKE